MIAYLEKYDTTVELPDDIGQKDLADINENFHSYVDPKPAGPQPQQPEQPSSGQPSPPTTDQGPPQKWQPNFYESVVKPLLPAVSPAIPLADVFPVAAVAAQLPGAPAMAGKELEEGTFGLAKPLTDQLFAQAYKDHPAYAVAGEIGGQVGSLLVAGGALRMAGLGAQAALAGRAAVDAGFAAGERFIPRAIMTGATFGTRTFIAETVKAFEQHGVNLEQFGKDVLKDTAFGGIFGTIGGMSGVAASVSSAAGLGFISSKMAGSDNREAALHSIVWGAFEAVGLVGRTSALRLEVLGNLKESIGEYIGERNPGLNEKDAQRAASLFVDHAIQKAGYASAEDIAKSGPENLLEGIEKVNQIVRNAKVPATPEAGRPALPKLPAPIEPEAPASAPAPAPAPKSPLDKAIETVKGILGIKPEPEVPKPIEVKGDTYEQKIQSLKDQGHDVSKMPESAFPEDMKDVYHFEQGKAQAKSMADISGRMTVLGVKPEEQAALLGPYGLTKRGSIGQQPPLSDLIQKPIEEQYDAAYKALAAQRGIDKGDKYDSRTRVDAELAVDLVNGYFNPKSQEVRDFATQHKELSNQDVAQMAYHRDLIEAPNADLLKVELEKAKQEKISRMVAPGGGQGSGPSSQGPQEPTSSAQSPQPQSQTSPGDEVSPDILFPSRGSPSHQSVTGDPAYVNMRQKAAEIVNRFARERGISPTPEFATQLFTELHDAFGAVRNAPAAERAKVAQEIVSKYPNLQKDFITLKDQLQTDAAPIYFKQVKGEYLPPKGDSKVSAMLAPGAAVLPKTPEDVLPAVTAHLQESKSEIENLLVPTKAAPLAAQITRETLGKMARSYDIAEAALADAREMFDKQPKESNLDFIDRLERGQEQQNSPRGQIAETLRKLLDDKRKEIQALGTGKMQSFIENYFPHIWDQGEKQVSQSVMKAAKRPFEGSKSFLKKRTIEFTKDGIEKGLTPVSYNPVDLVLLKMREMDKYLAAHRTIQEYKKNGLAKYVKIGGEVPEGWTKIDDRMSTVFKSPMVAVKEAYDEEMMKGLNAVGKSLGIDLERSPRMKGEGKRYGDVWGLSMSNPNTPGEPGKVFTRFAGPESALAHELGHQIDHIYSLQSKFLSDPVIRKELSALGDQRVSDIVKAQKASAKEYDGLGLAKRADAFRSYVQQPDEKIAAMFEAYIHAPELLKETAPQTYAKLTTFLNGEPKLKPLTEIKPSLVLGTNESEVYAGGAVIAGHIYAQPDAARIINNYLSPGLQKSALYQAYRYAGNAINQFQLGFSAFHVGFTSVDASVSKFALALNQLADGHPINAIRDALMVPFAPIQNVIRGNELLKAWRGEGRAAADDVLAQAMATAGGRARMDQFYATGAYEQMKHYLEAGKVVRGILQLPMAIVDLTAKPLLEYIVPRQKLGVFADIMRMEMENHPNMTHEQLRQIAQRAWDSVDNRMGQLVYDNLFWNRTFKDLLMASVRSVGWNLGTIRELAGGAADYAEAFGNAARGKKSDFTYRMAYFTALPIVVGTMGAIMQYLRTGKGPQELKDYWFPKTGALDANGQPGRASLPSYMKDVYAYSQHPFRTIINKASPIISMVGQSLENKDYYGTKIRNEDDPLVKQLAAEATYIVKQVTPFSVRNMQRNLETGSKSLFDTVGPWVGITPAPYDINQSKAEKLAHEIAASHQEIGGRTQEQAERSKLLSDLTRQYRRGDPKATDNLYQAYQQGLISHQQMKNVIVHASMTPLQRMVSGFSLPETQRVYGAATNEEKAQIESVLRKKEIHQRSAFEAPAQ